MSLTPRYTLRCLRDDLGIEPPKLPATLDDLDDTLITAARLMYAAAERPTQRATSIKDTILLKCKPTVPWRAAIWEEPSHGTAWLVAAGPREDGSRDDFYEDLSRRCREKRKRLNERGEELDGKLTYSRHLLPTEDDRLRLEVDRVQIALREARASVGELVDRARHAPGSVFGLWRTDPPRVSRICLEDVDWCHRIPANPQVSGS